MGIFAKQPIFCPMCGVKHMGQPERPVCSEKCYAHQSWMYMLYVVGKEYYPPPICGKTFIHRSWGSEGMLREERLCPRISKHSGDCCDYYTT